MSRIRPVLKQQFLKPQKGWWLLQSCPCLTVFGICIIRLHELEIAKWQGSLESLYGYQCKQTTLSSGSSREGKTKPTSLGFSSWSNWGLNRIVNQSLYSVSQGKLQTYNGKSPWQKGRLCREWNWRKRVTKAIVVQTRPLQVPDEIQGPLPLDVFPVGFGHAWICLSLLSSISYILNGNAYSGMLEIESVYPNDNWIYHWSFRDIIQVSTDHCKRKLLWPKLRTVQIYGCEHK